MVDYDLEVAKLLQSNKVFCLLSDTLKVLESHRIWNGSGWTYNPINAFRYQELIPELRETVDSIIQGAADVEAVKAASEPIDETDIVFLLNKRAEIRRQISTRKSVQEGKPDRIATLLEQAALEITMLRNKK